MKTRIRSLVITCTRDSSVYRKRALYTSAVYEMSALAPPRLHVQDVFVAVSG